MVLPSMVMRPDSSRSRRVVAGWLAALAAAERGAAISAVRLVMLPASARRRLIRACVTCALLAAAALPGARVMAQDASALAAAVPPGSKVRLLAIGGYSAEGELLRLAPDSILVRSETIGTVGLPIAALRRLEVERTTTPLWSGVRRGLLWGGGLGVVATALAATATDRGILDFGIALPILSGTLIAGGVGGGVFMRGKSWQSVPLPDRSP
jgi:hypothetical protein